MTLLGFKSLRVAQVHTSMSRDSGPTMFRGLRETVCKVNQGESCLVSQQTRTGVKGFWSAVIECHPLSNCGWFLNQDHTMLTVTSFTIFISNSDSFFGREDGLKTPCVLQKVMSKIDLVKQSVHCTCSFFVVRLLSEFNIDYTFYCQSSAYITHSIVRI